jgi:hypothetical protein
MEAFAIAGQEYYKANKARRAKVEDVFDIITVAGAEIDSRAVKCLGGFTASIAYSEPWQSQTALDGSKTATHCKALRKLLGATEILIAEKLGDE